MEIRDREWSGDCQDLEREGWRVIVEWVFPFGKMKRVLWMEGGDGCTAIGIYFMSLNCTFKMVKMVNFVIFYN